MGGVPGAGLCNLCRHQAAVPTARAVYSRCLRERDDPRYPKYPPVPVSACRGFVPREPGAPDRGDLRS